MPSFLDQLSVKRYWKEKASLPVIRGMEAREDWLPESEQIIQRLSEFGELLERNKDPLTREFITELLGLLAYLHSGYALRIVSFFDDRNPEFAQILVEMLQHLESLDEDIALHVMASRIRCLKNMKVLSTVFAKERIAMVLQALQAAAEENEGNK